MARTTDGEAAVPLLGPGGLAEVVCRPRAGDSPTPSPSTGPAPGAPAPERYGTGPDQAPRHRGQGPAAPVAPAVLEALTGILADFTDVPVTPDSTFKELGATSLTLVLTHRRLREGIAPRLALADMFEHPTVAALAARITVQSAPDTDRAVTAAGADAIRPPASQRSERPTRRTSRVAARALAEETTR
ncbi:hypothetical protein B7767_37745 [Streptomyces sp. 13-12-16]|nr:hypothetical protein B7767_37745 [Streptomyces sp. 13-12-16]